MLVSYFNFNNATNLGAGFKVLLPLDFIPPKAPHLPSSTAVYRQE
jgi:hypothetical protein